MKKILFPFLILFIGLFSSCEEVIDLELDSAAPRLVIEASIVWIKGSTGNAQKIKLSTTTGYYDTEVPIVTGATVFITNSQNTVFDFEEIPNTGEYTCTTFEPEIGENYTLTIIHDGETYSGTEIFQSLAPITRIEQNNEGGFTGKDIEIKAFFNDPADADNYYLYRYEYSNEATVSYNVDDDRFSQGNENSSRSQNDELKAGDIIELTHYGVSKQYYNYMNILIGIIGNSGGPFQTPPATVRGNIVNTTNPQNYPLGYFYLGETDMRRYEIE
ncbi:DUF4249 domain-containing protein [Flavobacterium sp. FBOR7N2.3]|uniref:DUF4249 domain-containing protein n=1 Tax=Flavobacterium magnesitis TaxID=3138077 RepID=A0ABV4TIC7_9FLAO